jgi:hypothetical protein
MSSDLNLRVSPAPLRMLAGLLAGSTLAALVLAGCEGVMVEGQPVVVANADQQDWTIRVTTNGEVLGFWTVPAGSRIRLADMPKSSDGVLVVALDAACWIVTPETSGTIPTDNAADESGAIILDGGDVVSTPVTELGNYPETPATTAESCGT